MAKIYEFYRENIDSNAFNRRNELFKTFLNDLSEKIHEGWVLESKNVSASSTTAYLAYDMTFVIDNKFKVKFYAQAGTSYIRNIYYTVMNMSNANLYTGFLDIIYTTAGDVGIIDFKIDEISLVDNYRVILFNKSYMISLIYVEKDFIEAPDYLIIDSNSTTIKNDASSDYYASMFITSVVSNMPTDTVRLRTGEYGLYDYHIKWSVLNKYVGKLKNCWQYTSCINFEKYNDGTNIYVTLNEKIDLVLMV